MTNDSIDNIRLDINKEKVRAVVYVRQNDTKTRTIHCTLCDNGKVIDLSDAVCINFLLKKTDGMECDQGCVQNGNEIQYTLRTQDLTALGDNKAQFMVTFGDGAVITSPEFSLMVYQKVLNQNVQQSLNEYTGLTQNVAKAKEYADASQRSSVEAGNTKDIVEDMTNRVADNEELVRGYRDECSDYYQRLVEKGFLELGEASNNAYPGDKGKIAYDHSQTVGNPHGTSFNELTSKPSSLSEFMDDLGSNPIHTHEQYLMSESDPTVPSWAKQSTKPSYTANEVGAYSKTEIDNMGFLTGETDPTVPSWAKASKKPTYTASEVGAYTKTEVDNKLKQLVCC